MLARRQVERALEAVQSGGGVGGWAELEDLLAGFIANFGWGLDGKTRGALGVEVTSKVRSLQITATWAVRAWKEAYAGEMGRRREQERGRELMRLIVRAWREVSDEREAKWLLPTGRTAPEVAGVPAGSQAWALLLWVRLVAGGRLAP